MPEDIILTTEDGSIAGNRVDFGEATMAMTLPSGFDLSRPMVGQVATRSTETAHTGALDWTSFTRKLMDWPIDRHF